MVMHKVGGIAVVLVFLICVVAAVPAQAAPGSHGQVRRGSRRTGRRTSRRVTRRRIYQLPTGHTTVVRDGKAYYVSDGVHYVQQMEAGKAVYVEVEVKD